MRIEHRSPTYSEYKTLRHLVGWPSTDEDATRIALNNSLFCSIAIDQGNVVGFGRIIGDGGLYFYIQDVIVHPASQGQGTGKILMQDLMSYISANAKPGAFVGLMAAKGLETYYETFGFRRRDEDAPGMYRIIG